MLINDQTLEPTQVAGFNQFFDDLNSTEAWRYGGALDQKFTQNIFGGAEFSYRDLKIPFRDLQPLAVPPVDQVVEADGEEYLGRAYLFWTPHQWVALSAEYQYERFNREDIVAFFFKQVNTHKVPLGVGFFHPSGLSLGLKVTYYNQDGQFKTRVPASATFIDDTSEFWLADVAINYRLPKRNGFVTLGGKNIFDNTFNYQETDLRNPRIQPADLFFAQLTLALP